MRVGSRVLYKNKHYGEVSDFTHTLINYGSDIMLNLPVIKVRFDKRWKYDMGEDRSMLCHKNELKEIFIRVFSDIDPYGEENWD